MIIITSLLCLLLMFFALRNYLSTLLLSIVLVNEGVEVDNEKMKNAKNILLKRILNKVSDSK